MTRDTRVKGDYADILAANQTYPINEIKAGIYKGLYSPNATLSDVQASCQSGNCTWPAYSSLAICASTADVSTSMKSSCSASDTKHCNYSLPSGAILAGDNEFISILSTDNETATSIAFQQTNPLADFFTFLISNKTSEPLLLESALHLCVQNYDTRVVNGKTQTKELNEPWTDLNTTISYEVIVPDDPAHYLMGKLSFETIQAFLKHIFQGQYNITNNNPIYGSDAIEVFVETLLVAPYDLAAMINFLTGFATCMTNA